MSDKKLSELLLEIAHGEKAMATSLHLPYWAERAAALEVEVAELKEALTNALAKVDESVAEAEFGTVTKQRDALAAENAALKARIAEAVKVAAENRNHKQLRVGALAMDLLDILAPESEGSE